MEPEHGHRRPIVVQEDLRADLVDERVADRVLDVQGHWHDAREVLESDRVDLVLGEGPVPHRPRGLDREARQRAVGEHEDVVGLQAPVGDQLGNGRLVRDRE